MSPHFSRNLTITQDRVYDLPQEDPALLNEAAHALDPFGGKQALANDERLLYLWTIPKTM